MHSICTVELRFVDRLEAILSHVTLKCINNIHIAIRMHNFENTNIRQPQVKTLLNLGLPEFITFEHILLAHSLPKQPITVLVTELRAITDRQT